MVPADARSRHTSICECACQMTLGHDRDNTQYQIMGRHTHVCGLLDALWLSLRYKHRVRFRLQRCGSIYHGDNVRAEVGVGGRGRAGAAIQRLLGFKISIIRVNPTY